jgi:hypothetical protein
MIKIQEDNLPWTAEEKLYMPDASGTRGIDVISEKIMFVRMGGDIGLSKEGETVSGIPRNKTILLLFENPCRNPSCYAKIFQKDYMNTMSTVDSNGTVHYIIPRSFNTIGEFFDRPRTQHMCFIGNPKDVLKSIVGTELMAYDRSGFRSELVIKLSSMNYPGGYLHVYGDWNDPAINSKYRYGIVGPRKNGLSGYCLSCPRTAGETLAWDGKFAVLSKHRFALCIENAQFPGHITEKIFQALSCGCIPVYIGAPNIEKYVDPSIFIDGRGMSPTDIYNRTTRMTDAEATSMRVKIRSWLADNANSFSSVSFAKKLIEACGQWI